MRMSHARLLTAIAVCVVACAAGADDPRIPPEVRFKSGYLNPAAKPDDFNSAMLWGIAIADPRVPGYEKAQVEIAHTQLSCRVDSRNVVLNNDRGHVRGGLYRRYPWFGTDAHDPMPTADSADGRTVILRVGKRADRIWHFWAASPRQPLPKGHLEGCTVTVRARISRAALLQVGFDYWRNPTVGYGNGGNNQEGGASRWYLPSTQWQDAVFTNVKH